MYDLDDKHAIRLRFEPSTQKFTAKIGPNVPSGWSVVIDRSMCKDTQGVSRLRNIIANITA